MACVAMSSNAFAQCSTNARGETVCRGANQASGSNPNTGQSWSSEKNSSGVTTTESSGGGEAKTKNGKGVYTSPSGKKCAKTENYHGCQ